MAKQFDNPYAGGTAPPTGKASERKPPQRPVYDYDRDTPEKDARKKPTRLSYGYDGKDDELVPAPSAPLAVPKSQPLSSAPRGQASAPMRPRPSTESAGAARHAIPQQEQPEDEFIRPNAAVTPAARLQREARMQKKANNAVPMPRRSVPMPPATRTQPPQQTQQPRPRTAEQALPKKLPRPISYEDIHRKRLRRNFAMVLGVVAAVLIGFVLSVTVLFKIETISVEFTDTSIYTPEQVTAVLNFTKGDNLFGFQSKNTKAAVLRALPYLESLEVQRRLPNNVKVVAVPARESFAVYSDYGWAVLSGALKVLRVEGEPPAGITQLQGILAQAPIPGQPVIFAEETQPQVDCLQPLYAAIEAQGLTPVTEIDLTSNLELSFLYDGHVRVKVGTTNELNAKLEWAGYLLNEQKVIAPGEKGTLDVSTRNAEGRFEGVVRVGKL